MMISKTVQARMELVEAAMGRRPYDLLISNCQVVNVFNQQISLGNIGIKSGRIATTQAAPDAPALEKMDAHGCFAIPGLIDTHVHIDSTLLTPAGLVELTLPRGTTALFVDPMEISNVAGYYGLEALFHASQGLPTRIHLEISSRVPTAPGLETTGGRLGPGEVKRLLAWPSSVSLGELDPSKVLGLKPEYFAKIDAALQRGKIANGHAIGLEGRDLDAYAAAGLFDDHECETYEQGKARVALGMAVLVREGSTERNLDALVGGLVRENADTRHWMMCTDDKHPNEILAEGHIDYMVNKAIQLGLPPIQAIQMATLNAAAHFRLEHEIGSLSPGRRADFLLSERLDFIKPVQVFFDGHLVVEHGHLTSPPSTAPFPETLRHTFQITRGFQAADYQLDCASLRANVRVIEILPDRITNHAATATLSAVNGHLPVDISRDILKLAVVERYGKNGNIGLAFVHGFGLKRGAIASSVSHDHHNLVIAGADEQSMATCARAVQEMQGGLVAADGSRVLASLPLPIGGLMSDLPPARVIAALDDLNRAAQSLGCPLPAPFMTLSFISLPTVPELGLTDKGLVDVMKHALISVFIP